MLPALLDGSAPRIPNDLREGGYFSGRKPEDGRIDWSQPAQQVYNLHRAVAPPYPGAFTDMAGTRFILERARLAHAAPAALAGLAPGLCVLDDTIYGVCGDGGALRILALRTADGATVLPAQLQTFLAP